MVRYSVQENPGVIMPKEGEPGAEREGEPGAPGGSAAHREEPPGARKAQKAPYPVGFEFF